MEIITVLTPTYNRKDLLSKLYDSLTEQTCKDFKWLIIDDGSDDGTFNVVEKFQITANFSINYKFKGNGGKHTALNYAYDYIDTPLIFIVDSDDTLTKDAIYSIKEMYLKYIDEKDLCGFSFLRGKHDGSYLSKSGVSIDGIKESYVECRINRRISGDMAEVWYTKCLKEFKFPEFKGEKFLGEDVVWIELSKKYKMRFFNKIIYISDYLADGLTNNRRKHNMASPKGCIRRAEVFLESEVIFSAKVKAILQYIIYGKIAKETNYGLFKKSHNKILFIIFFIPANILCLLWISGNK